MRAIGLAAVLVTTTSCMQGPPETSDGTLGSSDGAARACDSARLADLDEDFSGDLADWVVRSQPSCTTAVVDGVLEIDNTGTGYCGVVSRAAFDAADQTAWVTLAPDNANQGDPDFHFVLHGDQQTMVDLRSVGGAFDFRVCAASDCQQRQFAGSGRFLAIHIDGTAGQVWAAVATQPDFVPDATFDDPGLASGCVTVELSSQFSVRGGVSVPILVDGINQ